MRLRHAGFTLFEVLVALAILAVALSAVTRLTVMGTDTVGDMRNRTLALWIAEDRLAFRRAARQLPDIGKSEGTVTQAGIGFVWTEDVKPTPNRGIRRVEISVALDGPTRNYALAGLTGFLSTE